MRMSSDKVEAILIRQLTEPAQLLAHGSRRPLESSAPTGASPLTLSAPDGHSLLRELQRAGRISV